MWFRLFLISISVVGYVFGRLSQQHRYIVSQDNITITDVNSEYVSAEANVYKINETTNALNLTFRINFTVPEDAKVFATAYRWTNNQYRFCLIQIQKTIHNALHMESFDLDTLLLRSRPPITWPIQPGVTYHALGWSPDSTRFPPNLPEGSYKVPIAFAFANKTNLVVATWYLTLKYLK